MQERCGRGGTENELSTDVEFPSSSLSLSSSECLSQRSPSTYPCEDCSDIASSVFPSYLNPPRPPPPGKFVWQSQYRKPGTLNIIKKNDGL